MAKFCCVSCNLEIGSKFRRKVLASFWALATEKGIQIDVGFSFLPRRMVAPGGSAGASVVDRDVLADGGDAVFEGEVFSGQLRRLRLGSGFAFMPESRVKSFVSFKIATAAAAAAAVMAAPAYCLLAASAKCPAIVVTLTLSRESIVHLRS